jgi:tetratricopeptide (TPR) repeat protein
MQYKKLEGGTYTELENKNVDTGFGLDRLLLFLNGLDDGYKTDLFAGVIEYLEKALVFNPVCEYVLQELVERYLSIQDYEQAFKYIKCCLKNAYTKKQLAYGYKKLGQYFRSKSIYDKAIASFAVSNLYEDDLDNKIAIREITCVAGQIKFSSAEHLISLFKEEDINYGPSKHVIQTFANFMDYAKASNDKKTLNYVGKIAYELTDEKYYQDLMK